MEGRILGKTGRGRLRIAFIKQASRYVSMQTFVGLNIAEGDGQSVGK